MRFAHILRDSSAQLKAYFLPIKLAICVKYTNVFCPQTIHKVHFLYGFR